MPNLKRYLFISSCAPYGSDAARSCLDMVLAFGAFDRSVALAFLGDGVWNLIDGCSPNNSSVPSPLRALEIYGVTAVYANREDLYDRGLTSSNFIIPVEIIDKSKMQTLVDQSACVFAI